MSYRNRILVVDDDKVLLTQAEVTLEDYYEVCLAHSGQEALDFLADTLRVDLLLLDVRMPEMSGYELLEEIRECPVCRDVPVIFVTGEAGTEAQLKGFGAGVNDYITKPFHPDILLARVGAGLRAARRLDMKKIPETPETLSDMELAVLQLLALSYSNEDIMERMGYSYGYVRQIIMRLLAKLGIENRKDARNFLF